MRRSKNDIVEITQAGRETLKAAKAELPQADDDDADGLADYRATRKQLREQAEALHEIYRLDRPE